MSVGSRRPSDQRVIRSMKSSFCPNFGIDRAVGDVAAGRNVDVFEPEAAGQADADMARLAIVLPVVAAGLAELDPAEDRDAVVHLLALQRAMHVALLAEQVGREEVVGRLGFLQAEDIGLLLAEQALDDADPRTDRVHVPGGDLDGLGHEFSA